jgi:hypothetical protein
MSTELPPELEAIVLAVLEKRVKEAKAAARVPLESLYPAGRSAKVCSPLDDTVSLGTVGREFPSSSWQVTDQAALDAHLADDPDNIEYVHELAIEGPALVEALKEIAPDLLVKVERVRPSARRAAVLTAAAGDAPVPGISKVRGRSSLYVRPSKTAADEIERLVKAGLIQIDGRPVALPTSEQEAS